MRVRTAQGWRYEHRVVMEAALGRPIKTSEAVHHINGNRTDNRTDNLKLMERRLHDQQHMRQRWQRGGVPWKGRPICGQPRVDRHARGKSCRRPMPCPFHHPLQDQ